VAQDGSERAAQGQRALDVREAQVAERENDMKDLKHALQTQHSDLQHRHQQLQVRCYILLLLLPLSTINGTCLLLQQAFQFSRDWSSVQGMSRWLPA